ncbi:AAA family ATPase [Streptomyces laculatispora]|uniref:AAA family ATPase n=1 Tax=Streptomyces laculatispora TaxID=887464 RepID=UPI001A9491A4|nr:AAA family ATPase [Streptomyces laculatispora]MBO0916180.1 AAA family ATPase [Streptomyces laculatispora]
MDTRQPAEVTETLHTPAWTRRTYEDLIDRALALLSAGESVVVDATWNLGAWRSAATEAARRHDADLVCVRCEVPPDVARSVSPPARRARPTPVPW